MKSLQKNQLLRTVWEYKLFPRLFYLFLLGASTHWGLSATGTIATLSPPTTHTGFLEWHVVSVAILLRY